MKENIENTFSPEGEPKRIIVEIGPGDRPVIWRLERGDEGLRYRAGEETLFHVQSGDMFCAVDLPPIRSVDVFRHHWRGQANWHEPGKIKSHLIEIQRELDARLPRGAKGAVLHADGQRLPFADGTVDTILMANVMGGHVKDDEMRGFEASKKRILREKQNLIKEAKRVLKVGGKLIIEEEYSPADSVVAAQNKVFEDLEHDPELEMRHFDDFARESGILVFELTKREVDRDGS